MINNEFWYAEGGSRAEGRSSSTRQSKRWWLPSPQVPIAGLSDAERKKLLYQGKVVYQVFKAAKSINENVLLEMHVPDVIREALPKASNPSFLEFVLNYITWILQRGRSTHVNTNRHGCGCAKLTLQNSDTRYPSVP